jgi:NAD(P)H dehydrogenase (quinone)
MPLQEIKSRGNAVLVIMGATGKIGRATIGELCRSGRQVRAVVRPSSNTADLIALGCDIAIADARDTQGLKEAFKGATAVQVICPVDPGSKDPWHDMQMNMRSTVIALASTAPPSVLAISDYGAEIEAGTGITLAFHDFERQLRSLASRVTILRSCEHMQNWTRLLGFAIRTGQLPSLHHPITKLFPTVNASDVGLIAAGLLVSENDIPLRVVHAEGPHRYCAKDIADTLSRLVGKSIIATELPRSQWVPALMQGGLSQGYAELVATMSEVHNSGAIDIEPNVGDVIKGATDLRHALWLMIGR